MSIIKTGVSDYGFKPSYKPSGNVITDGKMTTANVPERTTGPNSVPEVTTDTNASLPGKTGGK